jgi:hypothetical protein
VLIASVVGGHAFYVFNSAKLNLVFMSRFINEEISYIQASEDGTIFTSLVETNTIQAWTKMHRVRSYQAPDTIIQFIVTKQMIFCLSSLLLTIFNTQTSEITQTIKFEEAVSGMMHPITYLNKLVFWSGKKVFLHNVIEDERIFSFKAMTSEVESIV